MTDRHYAATSWEVEAERRREVIAQAVGSHRTAGSPATEHADERLTISRARRLLGSVQRRSPEDRPRQTGRLNQNFVVPSRDSAPTLPPAARPAASRSPGRCRRRPVRGHAISRRGRTSRRRSAHPPANAVARLMTETSTSAGRRSARTLMSHRRCVANGIGEEVRQHLGELVGIGPRRKGRGHAGSVKAQSGVFDLRSARSTADRMLAARSSSMSAAAPSRRRLRRAHQVIATSAPVGRLPPTGTHTSHDPLDHAVAQGLEVALKVGQRVRSSWAALAMKSRRIASCSPSDRPSG